MQELRVNFARDSAAELIGNSRCAFDPQSACHATSFAGLKWTITFFIGKGRGGVGGEQLS